MERLELDLPCAAAPDSGGSSFDQRDGPEMPLFVTIPV